MKLNIDLQEVYNIKNITVTEYIYLYLLYTNTRQSLSYINTLGEIDFRKLEELFYIKFNYNTYTGVLREEGKRLFRVSKDLFIEFYNLFPQKTPKGRQLRTLALNTNIGRDAANKFKAAFKNSPIDAVRALEALRKEVDYRTATDQLEFMTGIVKWIEEGHYDYNYETVEPKIGTSDSSDLGYSSL